MARAGDRAPAAIGTRLRQRRQSIGLSQRDLSEPGVSYAYISRIEAGARPPSVKALRKLAPKLGVSVEWLETGEQSPARSWLASCWPLPRVRASSGLGRQVPCGGSGRLPL